MLKKKLFIIATLITGIYFGYTQVPEISSSEYTVSKEYFKKVYIKDLEDKKIYNLFEKKNRGVQVYLTLGGASAFLSTNLFANNSSSKMTISPFAPVTIGLLSVAIVKASRYSRKKKYLYVTGKQELPNYVKNRIYPSTEH